MDKNVNKLLAVLSITGILLGGGIGWGILQARVDNIIRENQTLRDDIELLKRESVQKEDFRTIIRELKNDNQVIKNDIKKILETLSVTRR